MCRSIYKKRVPNKLLSCQRCHRSEPPGALIYHLIMVLVLTTFKLTIVVINFVQIINFQDNPHISSAHGAGVFILFRIDHKEH